MPPALKGRRFSLYLEFFEVDFETAGCMQARAFRTGTAHIDALNKAEAEVQAHGTAATCREERKRNAHDGEQCQAHADVRNRLQSDKTEETEADAAAEIVPRF